MPARGLFRSKNYRAGCMTEVNEWVDILPAIEDAKRLWVELALERGRPIPERVGIKS